MNRKDKFERDYPENAYQVFKGYSVEPQRPKKEFNDYYVVPWAIPQENNTKKVY